jgi:hypothetical protein
MEYTKLKEYIGQLSNEDLMELRDYIFNDRDMNTAAFYQFFDLNDLDFLNSVYQSHKSIASYDIKETITGIIKREIITELFNRVEIDTTLIEKRFYESKSWNEVKRYIHFKFNGFTISSVLTKNVDKKHLPFSHVIEADPFFSSNEFYYSKSTDIHTYNRNKHEALFDEAAVQNLIAAHLDSIKKAMIKNKLKLENLKANDIQTQNYINFKKERLSIVEKKQRESDLIQNIIKNRQNKEEKKPDYLSIVRSELEKYDIDEIDSALSKFDTVLKFIEYFKIDFVHTELHDFIYQMSCSDLKEADSLDDILLIRIKQIALNVKADKYSQNFKADMFNLEYDFDEQDRRKTAKIEQGGAKIYISIEYHQPSRTYTYNCRANVIDYNKGSLSKHLNTVERYNKKDLESIKVDDELMQLTARYLYRNGIQLELADDFY